MTPDFDAWDAWHPREVAARLRGVEAPWYVAAGWALDLFRGGQSRPHEDLEIAAPAARFSEIADRFGDCEFYVVGNGEAVAYPQAAETFHQTWALDPAARVWRLDVFREPAEAETWICLRDERIRLPYTELIRHTDDGVPYLIPEVALLFKAKWTRPKDEADLVGTLPLLTADQRSWLAWALETAHPNHPWLTRL